MEGDEITGRALIDGELDEEVEKEKTSLLNRFLKQNVGKWACLYVCTYTFLQLNHVGTTNSAKTMYLDGMGTVSSF